MRACTKCNLTKPLFEFYKNAAAPSGLQTKCKSCHNSSTRAAKRANPEFRRRAGKRSAIYDRARRASDPTFRLRKVLRERVNKALKKGQKNGSAVRDLGCSVAALKTHLEVMFQQGMAWDNKGLWHIDHIRPLASFNLSVREEFLEACHYTNLQPLWAADNLRKGDR